MTKARRYDSICQERLNHLAAIALDVVETLLTDTETPINVRLNAAFRIFELCGTDSGNEIGQAIISGIEKNARELSYLETLLKGKAESQHNDLSDNLNEIKNTGASEVVS